MDNDKPRRRGKYREDRPANRRKKETDQMAASGRDRRGGKGKDRKTNKPQSTDISSPPRVVLMRPNKAEQATGRSDSQIGQHAVTSSASASRSQSPLSQPTPTLSQGNSQDASSGTAGVPPVSKQNQAMIVPKEHMKEAVKFLDIKKWSVSELVNDVLLPDGPAASCFKIVSVVGLPTSGKSRIMNLFSGIDKDVFAVHGSDEAQGRNLLQHVTAGLDLFITKERLFLLDSQPILSPSILDDYINSSIPIQSILSTDASETDLIFVTSLQVVSFLLSISDCLIVTSDWNLDVHLVKLLSTAIGMIGSPKQLNIIWFLKKPVKPNQLTSLTSVLQTIFGRGSVTVINGDDEDLIRTVLRVNTGREGLYIPTSDTTATRPSLFTEKSWFKSCVVYWDKLKRKQSLPSDFSRLSLK